MITVLYLFIEFYFSGLAISLITVLTILWLAVKDDTINPVDSLRDE